ncbi:MAG: hypothetical protein JWP25_4739 [Bradyrhizobium sp.]|jgi:hypothetical protein|nr:hypothetical protein [Bradyrhizobium sp.]
MISKTKLKALRGEAEHKKAVWGTSVKGCVRFVHLDPRVLLDLLDEFESLKSKPALRRQPRRMRVP